MKRMIANLNIPTNPRSTNGCAADDILIALDHLGIQNAHICGDPAPTK